MRSKLDTVIIGLITGILVPVIGLFVFYFFSFDTLSISEFLDHIIRIHRIPQLISLSVIANLGVFYIFIYKKFYYSARGVIMSTFLYTIVVLILKYLV